jgi:hypothetical protein
MKAQHDVRRRFLVGALVLLALSGCTAAAPSSVRRSFVRVDPTDSPSPAPSTTQGPLPPVKILTLGDSITAGTTDGQWQTTVCSLMASLAGRACQITNPAVSGTSCIYWPSRVQALLDAAQPDVVTFNCGTNDDAAAVIYGESATTWAWRSTVETIHNWRPATLIVPSWIQYSDPLLTYDWVLHNEPITNDHIYQEFVRHQSWFPAIADFQQIPSTADYLEGRCDPAVADCGIHPTTKGFAVMGRIEYDAIATGMGWPKSAALCGLYGHRKGYPRPAYTPC